MLFFSTTPISARIQVEEDKKESVQSQFGAFVNFLVPLLLPVVSNAVEDEGPLAELNAYLKLWQERLLVRLNFEWNDVI